jgi:N-methylhydantoinase A/oxoprolinase/acetone carboxylase beta subunit
MNHRSNLRTKLVAAFLTTGIAVAGLGTTAWADTTTTTPAPAAAVTAKGCKHAEQRVDRLQRVRSKLESQLDRLQKAHQTAVDHHNTKRAQKLESRIDKATRRLEAVKDRMQKIEQRCDVTPAQASTSTVS